VKEIPMPATITAAKKKSRKKSARTAEAVLATKEFATLHRIVRAARDIGGFSVYDIFPAEVVEVVEDVEPLILHRAARCEYPDRPAIPDDVVAATLASLQQVAPHVWAALRVFERVFGPGAYLLPYLVWKDAV
jgi:hypothetical protein